MFTENSEIVWFKIPDINPIAGSEMVETAKEFYKEGILKLPFPHCVFQAAYDGGFIHILSCCNTEGELTGRLLIEDTWSILVTAKEQGSKLEILTNPNHNWTSQLSEAALGDLGRIVYDLLVAIILSSSMKNFIQEKVEFDKKVNDKRLKKGKKPLRDYITISIDKNLFRHPTGSKSLGITRIPHWRRGHLRRCPSGLIVPVCPTIVNWNGENITHKRYNIGTLK